MHIIAGLYKRQRLVLPDVKAVRPTPTGLREALFSMLLEVVPGSHFLDLSAGGGPVGLEALSRGAEHVTFVEPDPRALVALRGNIKTLSCWGRTTVQGMTVLEFLEGRAPEGGYDIVFLNAGVDEGKALRLVPRLAAWPALNEGACLALLHGVRSDVPALGPDWRTLADRRYGRNRLTLWQRAETWAAVGEREEVGLDRADQDGIVPEET